MNTPGERSRFLAAAIIVVLCAGSFVRASVYSDTIALFQDIVDKSPNKARPHNNLGDALKKAGRVEEAGFHFERALELSPEYPDALNNLATVRNRQGKRAEAIGLLLAALSLDPGHVRARFNLAMTTYEAGFLTEAAAHYCFIVETSPLSKEGSFAAKMLSSIDPSGQVCPSARGIRVP